MRVACEGLLCTGAPWAGVHLSQSHHETHAHHSLETACALYPVHNADQIRLYYYFSFAVAQDSGEFQTPLGKAQLGVGVVCAPDLGMGFYFSRVHSSVS